MAKIQTYHTYVYSSGPQKQTPIFYDGPLIEAKTNKNYYVLNITIKMQKGIDYENEFIFNGQPYARGRLLRNLRRSGASDDNIIEQYKRAKILFQQSERKFCLTKKEIKTGIVTEVPLKNNKYVAVVEELKELIKKER